MNNQLKKKKKKTQNKGNVCMKIHQQHYTIREVF